MNIWKKTALLLFAAMICVTAISCGNDEAKETESETTPVETIAPAESEIRDETTDQTDEETETTAPEETMATVSVSTAPLPHEAELVTNPTTGAPLTPAETDTAEKAEDERIYDYISGKTVTKELQQKRPVAIMLNNIKECLPQNSLLDGDMYYEFPVEGGITRIMMLVSDYANLKEVGSIRSSRDYYVDMLHTHDAIYIHAGGSPMAYEKLMTRDIDNMDAVTMYIPDMYYRDEYRYYNMAPEHSLMTTGERIVNSIAFLKYETEHDESFVPSYKFYDETVDNHITGSIASHIHMNSTFLQTVDFVYNEETGEYLRYQYGGMPHVDGLTGEQLSVKNVIILFTDVALIPGDTSGRLSVETIGSGQGYYITNGRRKVINWSRADATAPMALTYRDGEELILNSGKTYICVVDNSVAANIVFDYEW